MSSESTEKSSKTPKHLAEDISKENELKAKILQHQQEIQFLQSQLNKLQIVQNENNSPKTEENKSIVFDPSVQIIDETTDNIM